MAVVVNQQVVVSVMVEDVTVEITVKRGRQGGEVMRKHSGGRMMSRWGGVTGVGE